jgi:hypothetical protein
LNFESFWLEILEIGTDSGFIYAFQEDVFLLLGFVGQNWVFVLISEVDIYSKGLAQVVRALVFVVVP